MCLASESHPVVIYVFLVARIKEVHMYYHLCGLFSALSEAVRLIPPDPTGLGPDRQGENIE